MQQQEATRPCPVIRLGPNGLSRLVMSEGKKRGTAVSPLFLMKVNFRPSKLFLSRQNLPTSVPHKVFFGFKIGTETERKNVSSPPTPKKKRKKKSGFLPFPFPPTPFFHLPFPLLRSPSATSRAIPRCLTHREKILPSYLWPSVCISCFLQILLF